MDILNFQDLKIKRNAILSTPNPWLKFKIYAQICVALGKFATLQAPNFTCPIAADRSFYVRWSYRYLARGGIWLSCGGRPRR